MAAALENANNITIYVKTMTGEFVEIAIGPSKDESQIKQALHKLDPDAYPIDSIDLMKIPTNNKSNVSEIMNKLQNLSIHIAAAEEQKGDEKEKKEKKRVYREERKKLKERLKVNVSALENGDMIEVFIDPNKKDNSLVTLVDCDHENSLWFHFQVDRAKGMKIIHAFDLNNEEYSSDDIEELIESYPKQDIYFIYHTPSKTYIISKMDPGIYPQRRIDKAINSIMLRVSREELDTMRYLNREINYIYSPKYLYRNAPPYGGYDLTLQDRRDKVSPVGREQNLLEIIIHLDPNAINEIIRHFQESDCTVRDSLIHQEKIKKIKVSKGGATHRRHRVRRHKKKTRKLSKK